jgi:cytochrome P450
LHRHPAFWPDPDRFVPARFADPESRTSPRGAFLPFGAGPHSCLGSQFALLEARIVIAMVLQRVRLCLVPGHPVAPSAGITLRFRHGLRMTAERRTSRGSSAAEPRPS